MGGDVTLVTTKPPHPEDERAYRILTVENAEAMRIALEENFEACDALFMAAAVADYRPIDSAEHKIKREQCEELTLRLQRNPDILSQLSASKKPYQRVFGFAAESENLLKHAREKLTRKKLDAIVANDISRSDIGFNADQNEVSILLPDNDVIKIAQASKNQIAKEILLKLCSATPTNL
jgi:phosphopantothenoylcysteine decarboxylase/phosphopantothenate--cysteine ligase